MGELVDASTEVARKTASDKGLAFEFHADRGRVVEVDPDLTVSVLQNLVENAVKYTDSGRIDVSMDEHETT